jgi:hypothetical protein
MRNGNSIIDLVKEITQQIRTLMREEAHLIKAELSEKAAKLGKDATGMAIGGFVAYAGLIIFLGALGILLAFAFEKMGWSPALAEFAGLGIIGLVVMGIGAALLFAGLKAFKSTSLAPERTIETLQHLKGEEHFHEQPHEQPQREKEKDRSSAEIEASVLAKEDQMAETLEELGERVSLRHLRRQATNEVRNHPYRWGLVAMGAGLAGSYLVKRKASKD